MLQSMGRKESDKTEQLNNKILTENKSNKSSCKNLRKKMVMLAGKILVKT